MQENEINSSNNRKLELLSNLKTAFESLLFDRGSNSFGYFNFNGNFCIFCLYIKEILIDGIIVSDEEKKYERFWNLITGFFLDELNYQKKFLIADFKQIYKSLSSQEPDFCLSDWISKSLRNKTFINQLTYIFQFQVHLKKNYKNTAFILDEHFLEDFFVCIQAYENNNSRLLNKCKIDHLIFSTTPKKSNNNEFIQESSSRKNNQNTHRRIHSYPIFKEKILVHDSSELINTIDFECMDLKKIETDEGPLINLKEEDLNGNQLFNSINDQFNSNNTANVIDFINQLHLHSECSSLDKENSHFLMADLVIATSETIKSYDLLEKTKNKASSPIKIKKKRNQLVEKCSRSRSLSKSIKTNRSAPLRSFSYTELFSLNDSRISEILTNFKGLRINESVKSTQNDTYSINSSFSDSKILNSFSNTPISPNYSFSFEESIQLTNEGFDLVKEKSNRTRKFSWETKDIYDSASFIAFKIINFALNSTKLKAPNLKLFDYFLKSLEYNEIMRDFYFSNASTMKMRKETSDNLSASSIFLSHNEFHSKSVQPTGLSAESFILIDSENSLSSFSKIREIAISTLANKNQMLDNSFNLNSSRIIGDDSWAPVREQLIIKKASKISRNDLIKNQNYRCADCGLKIKDKSKQLKSFNYCEYFCKYFCRYCHNNETSYIPAEIIFSQNFKIDFQVCRKAKNFLDSIFKEPVFSLENLNPSLFQGKFSLFNKIKILRIKLYLSGQYVNSCRYADKIKSDIETKFHNEKFIFENTEVYSFYLMFKLKKSDFIDELRQFFDRIISHIKSCTLCTQRSHICEICRKDELIYPFDIEAIEKCINCFSCYHKKCINKMNECPKCVRLKLRALK